MRLNRILAALSVILVVGAFVIGCGRSPEPQGDKKPASSQPLLAPTPPQAARSTPPQGKSTAAKPDPQGTAVISAASRQTSMPLDQAVKDGKVEAEITGMGGSTGDAILLAVRRKVSEPLILTLTAGTVFKSVSGTVQNMLVQPSRASGKGRTPTDRTRRSSSTTTASTPTSSKPTAWTSTRATQGGRTRSPLRRWTTGR